MLKRFFSLALMAALLAACAPAAAPEKPEDEGHSHTVTVGDLEITDAWVRPARQMSEGSDMATPESGQTEMGMDPNTVLSAAYFVIHNEGGEADKLLSAESDVAKAAELHNVKMENDVMTMFQVPFIEVAADEHTTLKPGSYHVMLIGLTREIKVGEHVSLTLNFEKAGSVTFEAEVSEEAP
ncbi:MAG: copper chaperone PCu(A)C [Anaerolineales bacterium]|nr:copper chaperone PCu(A)C [Anaerolineales bacterium]